MSAKRIPKEHEDAIVAAYLNGATLEEAAASFGYSAKACRNALVRQGFSSRNRSQSYQLRDPVIPEEHQLAMIQAYLAGASALEAAIPFGYSSHACYAALTRHGLTARTSSLAHRQHAIDEAFFDQIDTEEKAYWLGFITADGSVNSTRKSLMLGLKIDDADHLRKFAASLHSEHPVVLKKQNKDSEIYSSAYISIVSVHLVQALARLDVSANKTFSVRPCSQVPPELLRHYWRGVFDGDGTIGLYKTPKPRWQLQLCGNFHIVTGFQNYVGEFVNSTATTRPSRSIFVISYKGKVAEAVARLLYADATIYLDRKYALAQKLLAGQA